MILPVFLILVVLSVGLLVEQNGINYYSHKDDYYLSDNQVQTKAEALVNVSATNLLIYDSSNETSESAIDNFKQIFEDMKVATTYIDVDNEMVPDFRNFDTVVVLTPDLRPLGDTVFHLMEWVESGGDVMFAMTLQKDEVTSAIEHKLGIINASDTYAKVEEVSIKNGFMLGAGQDYALDKPFDSAWAVELDDNAEVYLTTGDDSKIPLVWEYDLGHGHVVVDNFGIYDKAECVTSLYTKAKFIQEEVGCDIEKCRVISNGIHYDRFSAIPLKEEDGWIDIGAVVRIAPIKDIKTMLYVFYELSRNYPNTRLHILGAVDDETYNRECHQLIRRLGIKNVIFTGQVNVVEYMENLDFTILTSISEAQPLSVIESMAARRPCVTTDVGCCRELLEGNKDDYLGIAGYCIPPTYRTGLTHAMEKMCSSRQLRLKMGEIAQKRARTYYLYEMMIQQYRDLYLEVV